MLAVIGRFRHRSSALLFLFGMVLSSVFVGAVLQTLLKKVWWGWELAMPLVVAQAIGIACAVLVMSKLWRLPSQPIQSKPHVAVLSFCSGFAIQFPLSALGGLVQNVFPVDEASLEFMYRLVYPDDRLAALLAAVGIGCVVPLCEEWLYRRTLLPRLLEHFGEGEAVLVSALVFGLVHVAPHAIVGAAIAGVILGWLFLRLGFAAAITFHAGVNLAPFALRPEWIPIHGFNLLESTAPMPFSLWFGGLLFGTSLLFFVFRGYGNRGQRNQNV